jgi:hypothetical protein
MSARDLEAALADLEDLARKGKQPSHYAARHLLLELGQALAADGVEACRGVLDRALAAGSRLEPGWSAAVREELALASAEFARCLEPRYLSLPNYDLEYTQGARARLEDRLRAARALGFDLPERESEMVELADRVLGTLTEKRAGRQGPAGGTRPDVG